MTGRNYSIYIPAENIKEYEEAEKEAKGSRQGIGYYLLMCRRELLESQGKKVKK